MLRGLAKAGRSLQRAARAHSQLSLARLADSGPSPSQHLVGLSEHDAPRAHESLRRLATERGVHAVALVLHSLPQQTHSGPKLASELFSRWNLGIRGLDNGLLLLVLTEPGTLHAVAGTSLTCTFPRCWQERLLRSLESEIRSGDVAAAIERFGEECNRKAGEKPYGSRASTYISIAFLALLAALQARSIYERAVLQQCPECSGLMRSLHSTEVEPKLSEQWRFEKRIGSATFQVQRCRRCNHEPEIERCIMPSLVYEQCAFCGTRACQRTSVSLLSDEAGRKVIGNEYKCDYCHCGSRTLTTLEGDVR